MTFYPEVETPYGDPDDDERPPLKATLAAGLLESRHCLRTGFTPGTALRLGSLAEEVSSVATVMLDPGESPSPQSACEETSEPDQLRTESLLAVERAIDALSEEDLDLFVQELDRWLEELKLPIRVACHHSAREGDTRNRHRHQFKRVKQVA